MKWLKYLTDDAINHLHCGDLRRIYMSRDTDSNNWVLYLRFYNEPKATFFIDPKSGRVHKFKSADGAIGAAESIREYFGRSAWDAPFNIE